MQIYSVIYLYLFQLFFSHPEWQIIQKSLQIQNSGMSFVRFLRPFILTSLIIFFLSFTLGNFIIPESNNRRIDFENKYLNKKKSSREKDIHIQISQGKFIYMQSFNKKRKLGINLH